MRNHKHNNEHMPTRIAVLEHTINHIQSSLNRIEKRFDKTDLHLDELLKQINSRFSDSNRHVDEKISKLDSKLEQVRSQLYQIVFLIASSVLGVIIAKILHWV